MSSLPIVTPQNYFSREIERAYMGSTQFKRFAECPAKAVAMLNEEWAEQPSTALLVGSYVDAHFSGTLDLFRAQNPEILKRDGTLKADYEHANEIIARCERDAVFMEYISGEPQRIMTGVIAGVPFKVKIDSYHEGKMLVDLKVMRDLGDVWVPGEGKKPFVEAWRYDIQAAIYQEVERQSRGDFAEPRPFIIAAVSKEKPEPDINLFYIPQSQIDLALEEVNGSASYYNDLKQGIIGEPPRCEKCDYCRNTRVLTGPVDYRISSETEDVF